MVKAQIDRLLKKQCESPSPEGTSGGSSRQLPRQLPAKGLNDLNEIKVIIEKPYMGTSFWNASKHASLETYLESIPELRNGYELKEVKAYFDKDHQKVNILTVKDLEVYFEMDSRGPLYIHFPDSAGWQAGMEKNFASLGGYAVALSKKAMASFMQWVSDKKVDEDQVKAEEEKLQQLVVCTSFAARGNVNQYEGVSEESWQATIDLLKKDDVPDAIINGLQRAKLMARCNETSFDLEFKDGELRNAYLVRLLTVKTPVGINAVIFHYQLNFKGADNMELSPEQAMTIERYVDKAAMLKWKEKMQQPSDFDF